MGLAFTYGSACPLLWWILPTSDVVWDRAAPPSAWPHQAALRRAPQPRGWHVKNLSDDRFFFFLENQMKAVKQRDESVSDITEVRPHLPDEISAFFPVAMLQTHIRD